MERSRLNIKLLTSSRADYSIYYPLLKELKKYPFFDVTIVAFGTHLSYFYGYTVKNIEQDNLFPIHKIESLLSGTTPNAVAGSIGLTILKFADYWNIHKESTDLIICLGDRFEMFAAVSASLPYNIPIAHIQGGETTLGAIDESFRTAITAMSKLHFASTEFYAKRIEQIINNNKGVYCTGSLAIDNIVNFKALSNSEFKTKFGFELQNPVLCTFHPVTGINDNGFEEIKELIKSLELVTDQIIITMPNADASGELIRNEWNSFKANRSNVIIVESLGLTGYYTVLKNCKYVIGNSSSGIIEAASFGKYVINIGDRQKGRITGSNVLHVNPNSTQITEKIKSLKSLPTLNTDNIYGKGDAAIKIVQVLKTLIEQNE